MVVGWLLAKVIYSGAKLFAERLVNSVSDRYAVRLRALQMFSPKYRDGSGDRLRRDTPRQQFLLRVHRRSALCECHLLN